MEQNHLKDNVGVKEEDDHSKGLWDTALNPPSRNVLPTAASLAHSRSSIITELPRTGQGYNQAKHHLFNDIIPGLNDSAINANYYGFVTGGVTPAALLADNVVSTYDQNVCVHLVDHSVTTDVEYAALCLLKDLFGLKKEDWPHGTFTTGATGSNLVGLACGREYVLRKAVQKKGGNGSLKGLQVLSTLPHASVGKAAGILGIGRANVKSIATQTGGTDGQPLKFDFDVLEKELARADVATIVSISCGEVNTGRFATKGIDEFKRVRELCDKYNAWLHVDAAFGVFGRVLEDGPEFDMVKKGSEGIELADSITGDGHKLLNVPYDCGFLFSRHGDVAEEVFKNPNAAYLCSSAGNHIPTPLNIGVENSKRFRALPVYSTLIAYGKDGYRAMVERQIRLARLITAWLYDHPKYTVLGGAGSKEDLLATTYMIVLLRAKDEGLNLKLADAINATGKIFVSGTKWSGEAACRIAISNWKVQVERDFKLVKEVLDGVAQ
ncbi:pyridoxal-dependent decarboxylase [Microsporum canis CBS 113480]|uniref:Pyridoxal-dependent decarboxylase n=1 Tax=Arthroderma otae (strain ATCC MYA-4605 / CBS 113480) TaxID=554155 RepID=C5FPY8_ARTOC|nr:pyridoxal-dependent decarboxylase [Microsporum canis CBS 113480]EEQ31941.1 pyridoxal-dependent decarboxylase [Microsporum canis CBS 113480]